MLQLKRFRPRTHKWRGVRHGWSMSGLECIADSSQTLSQVRNGPESVPQRDESDRWESSDMSAMLPLRFLCWRKPPIASAAAQTKASGISREQLKEFAVGSDYVFGHDLTTNSRRSPRVRAPDSTADFNSAASARSQRGLP